MILLYIRWFNPIRRVFETTNDPGGGVRGRGSGKNTPPLTILKKYYINLHHIIHVHFTECFTYAPVIFFNPRF